MLCTFLVPFSDIQKLVSSRQQLDAQLNENTLVKDVSEFMHEIASRPLRFPYYCYWSLRIL